MADIYPSMNVDGWEMTLPLMLGPQGPVKATLTFDDIPFEMNAVMHHTRLMGMHIKQHLQCFLDIEVHRGQLPTHADINDYVMRLADSLRETFCEPGCGAWELASMRLDGQPVHGRIRDMLEAQQTAWAYQN